jgi:hypothetical protein
LLFGIEKQLVQNEIAVNNCSAPIVCLSVFILPYYLFFFSCNCLERLKHIDEIMINSLCLECSKQKLFRLKIKKKQNLDFSWLKTNKQNKTKKKSY